MIYEHQIQPPDYNATRGMVKIIWNKSKNMEIKNFCAILNFFFFLATK